MNIRVSYGAPRNKQTIACALAAALMIVIMLIAQLYGFEGFALVLTTTVAVNDSHYLRVLASCLVLAELLALPYLLGMYIGTLMRVLSAVIGFMISGFWLFVTFTNAHAANIGLFSDSARLSGGILAALWTIVLFGLVCKVIFADSRFRHDSLEVK